MNTIGLGVIEQMIHAASPDIAREARQAALNSISHLLEGVGRSSKPDVAWNFSHLTSSGVPIEFSWVPGQRTIRYTCEIGGPEADPADAVNRASHLLRDLGSTRLPTDLVDEVFELQRGAELAYGAWIGGRHSTTGSNFKVYAEAPPNSEQANRFVCRHFGRHSFLPSRPVQFQLFGYTTGSGRKEFYFRVSELDVWELGALISHCNLYDRADELLSFIKLVYGCRIIDRLPGSNFGFSISQDSQGEAGIFSLFTYADCVFGNEYRTREAVLSLSARMEWQCDDYNAMVSSGVHHGIIAFVIAKSGPPVLQVGLIPQIHRDQWQV